MRERLLAQFRAAFGREAEVVARAPGRIEVIGNHVDYNGGPVLGAAIDRSIWVGLARRDDARRRFGSADRPGLVELAAGPPVKQGGAAAWTNYPLGVLFALAEAGHAVPAGFDYFAVSNVPGGAGLSSSAAIELSSALVFLRAAGGSVTREALALLGRRAENQFVGVPCGILDQGISSFGRRDHLVYIDCRGPSFEAVPLPPGPQFWIFNTHTKHALIDGLYAARHEECMEAARGIGVGQLVEVSPAMLAAAETRLSRPSFKRAQHIVDEIGRVHRAVAALRAGDLDALGKLLLASHRSSKTWFENSTPELDFLVEQLEAEPGVYGARLTGGGFGGAVMALTGDAFKPESAERVAAAYFTRYQSRVEVLSARTEDGATLLTAGP